MSSTALVTMTQSLAGQFGMTEVQPQELIDILKATAFKSQDRDTVVSDAQMTALLVIANQYRLNPWTKEIHAFTKGGAVVPIVGIDGWSRIIN
jgi:hypothetical protein